MTENDLQNYLHSNIPLTKFMKIHIKSIEKNRLISIAPLDMNINDKGTAFGGSLSTMTIISSWSMCFYLSKLLGYKHTNIVVYKNESKFLRPVNDDIFCITHMPSIAEIDELKRKLSIKKRASIKIYSQIIENEKVCMDYEGDYMITLKEDQ